MRREFERILGEELRYLAIETRERLVLPQKEMGEDFQMGEITLADDFGSCCATKIGGERLKAGVARGGDVPFFCFAGYGESGQSVEADCATAES